VQRMVEGASRALRSGWLDRSRRIVGSAVAPHRRVSGPARRRVALIVLGVVTASFVASCGSSGGTPTTAKTTSTTASTGSTTPSGPAPVYEVKTGTVTGLGTVLVDGQGFTLYVFAPDKQSGSSTCYGECAKAWPPLVLPNGVSQAPAGPGVRAGLLGTTKRTDGTVEVTYNQWPLYTWVIDSAPGDATGQDLNNLGGKWYVITPDGTLITKHR
jgi:predicted lipoprotein with Yx(FWY)xxD motif